MAQEAHIGLKLGGWFSKVGLPNKTPWFLGVCMRVSEILNLVVSSVYVLAVSWVRFECCSKYRAESDLEHVQQDRKRLNSVMRQQERDLMQTQLREKQLSRTNKIVMGKLKTEKDEVFAFTQQSGFYFPICVCMLHHCVSFKIYYGR